MGNRSTINPLITLDYIKSENENKIFDRKSSKTRAVELAPIISAFANADGGTIVIGVSDKTRMLEGVNSLSNEKLNDLIVAPKDCCKPMPKYETEFLDITNHYGKQDRILLLHIEASSDQVIRTSNDATFVRMGDRSKELRGDDLRNLEYSKSLRHYEDECTLDASLDDLDPDLLEQYRSILNAEHDSYEQILSARGFIKKQNGRLLLTNAAVLLFAKNIQQFYPNCRIRFIRYDGTYAKVGTNINIIKDENIEFPILRIINKAKDFIATQLRDFTALDLKTGKFQVVPEYPEFAWQEAIVNAVTHREYAYMGNFITIRMFNDRLEIESPGELPNIVTLENITETRYSRNPKIARVLTEFGWVRELNEGVKRIYEDMDRFFLDAPEYSEPHHNVKLVLKNNIVMRHLRQSNSAEQLIGKDVWERLDNTEQLIITYLYNKGASSRAELESYTNKSNRPVRNRINNLLRLGIIKATADKFDPTRKYYIPTKDN